MPHIAFIGLGNMGGPMAANLAQAGRQVVGCDLVEELRVAAHKTGVTVTADPLEALKGADTVITMLPAGKHVRAVWHGLLPHAAPGTLFIDCSTIDIDSARAVHAMAKEAGLASLDAPVSGGTGGAKAGTLTFMVGGEMETYARGARILAHMGKKIVRCGDAGAGQAAKVCNNMILGISMIGVCEAFALAEKLGLSDQALYDVASTSSGQCWSLTTYCPVPGPVSSSPANNGYRPGFSAELMLKDLKLAQDAAAANGAAIPMGSHAAQLYAMFAGQGEGGMDFSAIIHMLKGRKAHGE